MGELIADLKCEIERLRDAKRRALSLADERAKEAVELRQRAEAAEARVAELHAQLTIMNSLHLRERAEAAEVKVREFSEKNAELTAALAEMKRRR